MRSGSQDANIQMMATDRSAAGAILYLHGIRRDDPDRRWLSTLNQTLQRHGNETLEQRGFELRAPRYLDLLEAESLPDVEAPNMTYRKGPDEEYQRAAGDYWAALADLDRTGIRGHVREPQFGAGLPADMVGAPLLDRFFEQASRYRSDAHRRNAILRRILAEVPAGTDLVIVGHSLGSVIAADLIYFLPSDCPVKLLLTLGSPLGLSSMRDHLERQRSRFPYERIGPWVNVVETSDFMTGFRGLSSTIPEALDVFIEQVRTPAGAHVADTYLDSDVVPVALDWLDKWHRLDSSSASPSLLPDFPIPETAASILVGCQYALQLERSLKPGDQRARFGQARRLVLQAVAADLEKAIGPHPILGRLSFDNSALLRGRFDAQERLTLLLTAWMTNPVLPFEFELPARAREDGLDALAQDLGVPAQWASLIRKVEDKARSIQHRRWSWQQAAMVVAGLGAVVAVPMLVAVAAPAGLGGAAAMTAGLAALGPGGMLGGVGVVSLLGGGGGALAAAALTTGTPPEVEETVIYLLALALAGEKLNQPDRPQASWGALVAMEDALADEHARLVSFSDDGADGPRTLEQKLGSVRQGLEWLTERGLAPKALALDE